MAAGRREEHEERRAAALEMGALAAVGHANRMRLLDAGCLQVLMMLGVTDDSTTREYAAEALATLLESPQAVEAFVKNGGLEVLFALLQDSDDQTVREAVGVVSHVLAYPDSRLAFVRKRGVQEVVTLTRRLGMLSDLTTSTCAPGLRTRPARPRPPARQPVGRAAGPGDRSAEPVAPGAHGGGGRAG